MPKQHNSSISSATGTPRGTSMKSGASPIISMSNSFKAICSPRFIPQDIQFESSLDNSENTSFKALCSPTFTLQNGDKEISQFSIDMESSSSSELVSPDTMIAADIQHKKSLKISLPEISLEKTSSSELGSPTFAFENGNEKISLLEVSSENPSSCEISSPNTAANTNATQKEASFDPRMPEIDLNISLARGFINQQLANDEIPFESSEQVFSPKFTEPQEPNLFCDSDSDSDKGSD